MHVLVVEDEDLLRLLVIEVLADAGHCVLDESSGEAALALPMEAPPAVIVTNINLGGMNGFEYVQRVRSRWPSIGVVFVSGNPANLVGVALGSNDRFLPKPFNPRALLAAVQEVACSR